MSDRLRQIQGYHMSANIETDTFKTFHEGIRIEIVFPLIHDKREVTAFSVGEEIFTSV